MHSTTGIRSTRAFGVVAAAALAALLASLFVAGCGSGADVASPHGPGTGESAASEPEPTGAEATTAAEPSADEVGTEELEPPMGSPPAGDTRLLNIAQIAAGTDQTQTLTRSVLQAGLLPTVRDGGPFTVFAPVEAAFAAVPLETLIALQNDSAQLAGLLTLHVVPGTLSAADLRAAAASGTPLTTVQGGRLKVETRGDQIVVGGATVAVPDIFAMNGVVHAVDTVITAPNG